MNFGKEVRKEKLEWTTFVFDALPGTVIEARLKSSTQDFRSYFIVTKKRGHLRKFPHLKPISKQKAHKLAIRWVKRRSYKKRWKYVKPIPGYIRYKVWKRNQGKCQICGNQSGLEFALKTSIRDGGTVSPDNVRIICQKHKPHTEHSSRKWHHPRHIPPLVKFLVEDRDQGKCQICGSRENIQQDHIIPVALGGASTINNLWLLCQPHNRQKSDKIAHPEELIVSTSEMLEILDDLPLHNSSNQTVLISTKNSEVKSW
jgi:5-methylcytosine-specific restriction endonuclease McrA